MLSLRHFKMESKPTLVTSVSFNLTYRRALYSQVYLLYRLERGEVQMSASILCLVSIL